jgi:glycerol-3-phosphate O-acyltransferase
MYVGIRLARPGSGEAALSSEISIVSQQWNFTIKSNDCEVFMEKIFQTVQQDREMDRRLYNDARRLNTEFEDSGLHLH